MSDVTPLIQRSYAESDLVHAVVRSVAAAFLTIASFAQSPGPLRTFLQAFDRQSGEDKTLRYVAAFVDLNGGRKKEAIVYLIGQDWCGSGGCTLLGLTPQGNSYKIVSYIDLLWPPIRMLDKVTNGWHNLSVWERGGAVRPGYEAELRFDGKTYSTSARPLAGRSREKSSYHPRRKGHHCILSSDARNQPNTAMKKPSPSSMPGQRCMTCHCPGTASMTI